MKKRAAFAIAGMMVFGLPIEPPPFFPAALAPTTRSLALAALGPQRTVIRGTIATRGTLASSLDAFVDRRQVHRLVESAKGVYDLGDVRSGRPFGMVLNDDGTVRSFAYSIDELKTLRLTSQSDTLIPELATRDYETRVETASGIIESSLFGTIDAMGERDELAIDLSEIFAWDIDFNTMIQRGDTFRVVLEKQYLDGTLRRYGRVLAAEFVNSGKTHTAVRFEGQSGVGYYDAAGEPLKKAFLKSPLRFTRVSSRFSTGRFHPILQQTRAHNGTDLAAPHGTPVRAIGHGAVTSAGWQGGYGKVVVIRHPNGFTSLYGHLSRIDVHAGQRVSQNDLVGLVGSTGLATGPHLHFGMTKAGAWTDPMRVQSPPAEPLAESERSAFVLAKDQWMAKLPPRSSPGRLALANPGTTENR